MRRIRVVLAGAMLALPIAALARAPYTPPGAEDAVLRLSWRMSATSRESCRPRTQEELDALPVHMRTPEVCTRDLARYLLVLQVGEAVADTVELQRRGAKGDRPLFVLEDRRLEPGVHRVRVGLHRVDRGPLAEMDTVLTLERGAIALVTLDDQGRLEARSSAGTQPAR